jgi:pilus assembly protein CpaF
MFMLTIEADGAEPRRVTVTRLPCRIGRRRDAEVVLDSWRVARVHAEIHEVERGLRLVDAGALSGTWVNGERIVEFGPLDPADEIMIAGFRMRVLGTVHLPGERLPSFLGDSDTSLPPGQGAAAADPALLPVREQSGVPAAADQPAVAGAPGLSPADGVAVSATERSWRVLLHQRLLQTIDLRRKDVRRLSPAQLRAEARAILESLIAAEPDLPASIDRARIAEDCLDEVVGLGPLERLMADPSVTEIMVNGPAEIFVERHGRLQPSALSFSGEAAVRAVIERIVAPLGRRIDESSPMVDARLPDGSRVNAVIPPLAVKGSAVTIRRFAGQRLAAADLPRLGSADERMVAFLHQCVLARRNLVIAGGTGSGKTTLLNLLAGFIPPDERVVTIEDAAELALAHPNLVRLEARPANAEGRGGVAIRDLLRNALRMRPDRIIVGECRGGEALDMLQAMNTGHDGSLTTVHANSARDVLARLETMVLMAGMELPLAAIREQIASAIQIVVQQARAADGRRRIVEISEITGTEGARILMQPLFRWRRGAFEDCGNVPQFFERLGLSAGAFPGRLEIGA